MTPFLVEVVNSGAFFSAVLWEFFLMPFDLCNAPASQQWFIEVVLNGLVWQCCFAYIDDILCYSSEFKQHLKDLKKSSKDWKTITWCFNLQNVPSVNPNSKFLGLLWWKRDCNPIPRKSSQSKTTHFLQPLRKSKYFWVWLPGLNDLYLASQPLPPTWGKQRS